MPRAKKRAPRKAIDVRAIPGILGELDSLLGAFADEDLEDVEYRLDALTTRFVEARLIRHRNVRRLKFHMVIEALVMDMPGRAELAEDMETFEDLINTYGDEPSEDEIDEAREILERVIEELKTALQGYPNEDQLRLDQNQ